MALKATLSLMIMITFRSFGKFCVSQCLILQWWQRCGHNGRLLLFWSFLWKRTSPRACAPVSVNALPFSRCFRPPDPTPPPTTPSKPASHSITSSQACFSYLFFLPPSRLYVIAFSSSLLSYVELMAMVRDRWHNCFFPVSAFPCMSYVILGITWF